MKDYVCRRLRVRKYLENNGFFPISYRTDRYNDKYFVWIFKGTEDVYRTVDEYYRTHSCSK